MGTAVVVGGGGGESSWSDPELVVPATALRRCEQGWGELLLLLHRGTGGGGASKGRGRDAAKALEKTHFSPPIDKIPR